MVTATDTMKQILEEIVGLTESPLYDERIKNMVFPVIGEGCHSARVMFIGEAPGKNEALTGRPFCGASGKVLDQLLEHIGVDRDTVYVTNVVKDRPPENRDPKPEEIALYAPFLDRQIEAIRPKVIATLGRFSMEYVMERYGLGVEVTKISIMRGKIFEASMSWGQVKIVPLYHPAVAVYNRNSLPSLKEDMEIVKKLIA